MKNFENEIDQMIKEEEELAALIKLVTYISENPDEFEANEEYFVKIFEKITKHTDKIENDIQLIMSNFSDILKESAVAITELFEFMSEEEKEKIAEETKRFNEAIEKATEKFDELKDRDDNTNESIIINKFILIIIPELTFISSIFHIYEKYFDKLPFEKMPKTFPDGKNSLSKKKQFDIADDLLFIDDLDVL
jgi:dGTP triphosphohydrolase